MKILKYFLLIFTVFYSLLLIKSFSGSYISLFFYRSFIFFLLIFFAYMASLNDNSIKKILYLCIFLFFLVYVPYECGLISTYLRNRADAQYRSCKNNMKSIYGALENYCIDHKNNRNIIFLEELVAKRYLSALPSCPGTTFRYISFLRFSEYGVPSKKQYEIIYDKDKHFVDIKCDIHGFLDADDGKYVGVPYYFRNCY